MTCLGTRAGEFGTVGLVYAACLVLYFYLLLHVDEGEVWITWVNTYLPGITPMRTSTHSQAVRRGSMQDGTRGRDGMSESLPPSDRIRRPRKQKEDQSGAPESRNGGA